MVQSLKENNTLKNTLDAMKNTPIPVAVRTVDTGIGMKLPYIESSTVGEVAGKFSKASTAAMTLINLLRVRVIILRVRMFMDLIMMRQKNYTKLTLIGILILMNLQ